MFSTSSKKATTNLCLFILSTCIIFLEVINMIFSEKLQLIRKNKGFTQEKLAEVLDVSRQAHCADWCKAGWQIDSFPADIR